MACAPIVPGGPFLSGMLDHIDCQAQAIGQGGYQALAAPGSSVSLILTGVLTIFVAIFGYRMLFGETPSAREAMLAVVKLGVVLVLATSWPAFRALAYDVALRGPAELAAGIGRPADLPGAGGGLVARLQRVDDQLAELALIGAGKPPNVDVIVGPTETLTPQQQRQELQRLDQLQHRPRWDPDREATTLGRARTLYLTGAIGAFASVRLIAGLLLALAPLFALFLLFRGTRGVFEGWVRGLGGAALGAVATSVVLGVQLAVMEPWLAGILAERRAGLVTPSVPVELLVMTLVFALTLLAALIATAWVARGFRFPATWQTLPARAIAGLPAAGAAGSRGMDGGIAAIDRPRAAGVADAIAAAQRREAAAVPPPAMQLGRVAVTARSSVDAAPPPPPLGQSFRRSTRARVSAGALRRDGRA